MCSPNRAVTNSSASDGSAMGSPIVTEIRAPAPRGFGPAATGRVVDAVAVLGDAHPRPHVRRAERDAGTQCDQQPARLERPEHDAVVAFVVDGVEPDVGLGEVAEERHRGTAAEAGAAHLERDQPDVRHAVEHVRSGAGRQQRGDEGRVDRPVDERQPGPVLTHQAGSDELGRQGIERVHISSVPPSSDRAGPGIATTTSHAAEPLRSSARCGTCRSGRGDRPATGSRRCAGRPRPADRGRS